MTVHGAKGLEAPIVILPDTVSDFGKNSSKIYWHEGDAGNVILWPAATDNEEEFCKTIKKQTQEEQKKEYYRLLYVAMTRAKSELYIMGAIGSQKSIEGCWYDIIATALDKIAAKDAQGIKQLCYGNPAAIEAELTAPNTGTATLPEYLFSKPGFEPNPTSPLTPSKIDEDFNYQNIDNTKILTGKIIHSLLEFLPDIEESLRLQTGRNFIAKKLKAFPAAAKLNLADTDTILQNLIQIMNKEELKHVFGKNSRAEVPIIGIVNTLVVSARIDRICVLGDKIIIIDYKTGMPPKSKDDIHNNYIKQMLVYKEVVGQIYPEKLVECYVIWTIGCVIHKL